MLTKTEDTLTTRRAKDALYAWIDSQNREKTAITQHKKFFSDQKHHDRVDQVCEILEEFFGREVDYINARGINRTVPFDNVKMAEVGSLLSKMPKHKKWTELYAPLLAIGDVDVISNNGHLLVRIYPVGKMPKRVSKNSVSRWYSAPTPMLNAA